MNGHTDIDPINPCSAQCDRETYGWRWFNWTRYGHRLIRIASGTFSVDLFWGGFRWPWVFISRMRSAIYIGTPVGSIVVPANDLLGGRP